ncbi:MAG: ankyrin repeat domain-containing protein, partial [Chloroflexota bacterium]|nr:ankyrin repeat domain-containing protein [Chloroflexota bacterium]
DPRRFRSDNRQPRSAVSAALEAGCAAELIELLLAHGADVNAPGPDGRPPYRLATSQGRGDAAQLLRRYGADERLTETDRFLSACLRNDRSEAENVMKDHPDVIARLSQGDKAILAQATETGNTAAVGLLLDLGFPIDSAAGDDGRTLLHAAAYSGSAGTVRLLLERGADIEARDTTWDGTPLQWAMVGSGESPRRNPTPDWVATVRTLIDAGAVTAGITLSPDDPKPPSREIAELLRAYGVGDEHRGSRASPSQSSQEIQ